ncbi:MAG: insulinase family protein [Chloroflexi bacterium]|nr:MAG: insulinase family protein [Chloroflexota bacterium]
MSQSSENNGGSRYLLPLAILIAIIAVVVILGPSFTSDDAAEGDTSTQVEAEAGEAEAGEVEAEGGETEAGEVEAESSEGETAIAESSEVIETRVGALTMFQYTLGNGLEVILVEDHSAPTVAVDVWYDVGGAKDPEGRGGFAHLFEHMMFQGSAHLDKLEHGELVEQAGGRLNAYTAQEITAYWDALPSHQLPLGLWLEAERLSSLAVTTENLNNQRAVVIQEFQQRVGDSPYGEAVLNLNTQAYSYEPFHRPVIGTIPELNEANVQEIRDFHSTYYVPNNATLVVAGDFDPVETQAMIEEFFGPIPMQEEPPQLPEYVPQPRTEAEFVTIEDPLANVPAILIGYEVPPRNHPDYLALQLVSGILSSGASSRMAQSMIDTGLATVANTGLQGNRGPSLFTTVLVANPGIELSQLEEIYNAELMRIVEEGVPQEELDKIINRIRSGQLLSLETAFGLAESVQAANFYLDDPTAIFTEIDNYAQVTPEDVQRVVAEYLAPERRYVINVQPNPEIEPIVAPEPAEHEPIEGEEEITGAFVLEQSEPPPPLEVTAFNLPDLVEGELSNGLDVIVVNRPELPIISLDFIMPGGGKLVQSNKAGLEGLTASLLTRGTETRSAQDIAQTIEQVGGAVGASASNDALQAGAFALIEDAPLAFELLGDIVMNPTFPEDELENARARSLQGLQFALADPGSLANRAFTRTLYGNHPYGNVTTERSLNSITRRDIQQFYAQHVNPETAFLIIAGDITTDEAMALAEETFGSLEAPRSGSPRRIPDPRPPNRTEIVLVDRPGSQQTNFIIGNLAAPGNDPNLYNLRVMNELLGGGFSSRLFGNIREDKGYAYSIGSGLSLGVEEGTFIIRTSVRNENAADALREILLEVENLQMTEVPEDELQRTKDGLVGSFALGLETYQDFVNDVQFMRMNGLPLDFLESFPSNIAAVDAAGVQMVAQEYIKPDQFVIVAVGDASIIRDSLSELYRVRVVDPA